MLIKDFLDEKRIAYQDFAEYIGVSRNYLYNMMSGRKAFSLELAKKIEEVTKGGVSRLEILYHREYVDKDHLDKEIVAHSKKGT